MMMAGRLWNLAVPIHVRVGAFGDDGGRFGARAPCAAGPSVRKKIEADSLEEDQARGSERDACAR